MAIHMENIRKDTDWEISAPENQGLDSKDIEKLIALLEEHNMKINSIILSRNGYIVLDKYFHGNSKDTKQAINSCTKSIISVLVGIAIDEGYIHGVDDKVMDYFNELEIENLDENKKNLRIEHLLTMTTGFRFKEPDLYYKNKESKTQLKRAIDMQTENEPGKVFKYFNGASHMLSALITKATGKSTFDYAMEKLFKPLSINNVLWEEDKDKINFGCSGIYLTPFEMFKFGYLISRKGKWGNRQLVSTNWIDVSTCKHTDTFETLFGRWGYGYQWWMNCFDGFSARGYGGQFIFIIPKFDIVAVFTGNLRMKDFLLPETLVNEYILNKIK